MSDAAKNRVISLGAQFNTFEKAAAAVPVQEPPQPKKSFWRKNVDKVPGRPVSGAQVQTVVAPTTSNVGASAAAKAKAKKTLSFQEFNRKTCDAWEEDDDDMMKVETPGIRPVVNRSQSYDPQDSRSDEENLKMEEESNESALPRKPKPLTSPRGGLSSLMLQRPVISIKSFKLDLQDQELVKLEKFGKLLAGPHTSLDHLRELSWSGIPAAVRPTTWQLLCGYLPANIDRRQSTLDRKRDEYHGFIRQYYHTRHEDIHKDMFRQIHIDIPRTNPLIPLFQHTTVQEIFERILYIWAIRHPASGYVQGINDLVTPFFVVFLSAYVDDDIEHFDVDKLQRDILDTIEADSFWCMSKLLDGIQDNYTFAQPGIQTKVNSLRELVRRINEPLHKHLEIHNVEYLQFAFRWMNNLLMREVPLHCTIRLWDTYLSEQNGFATFHLYVCASFLDKFSDQMLVLNDFQNLLIFLQNLPTADWGDAEIGLLLAEAYRWKYMFADAPKHLQTSR